MRKVGSRTGWLGISVLCLGEMTSLNSNFFRCVYNGQSSGHTRPLDTLARYFNVKQPTKRQNGSMACR